ncbi:MAG: beta strand repeat-containing protein [Gemmataceae bacterium]
MSPRRYLRLRSTKFQRRFLPQICYLENRITPSFSEFIDPHPAAGNQFGATVVALSTGNVVITSPYDDAGGTDAGAVYLFNGATGGLISTLTGSQANDNIGSGGVTALTNGNYVVVSPNWDKGATVNAGAVTWGSGASGIAGVVSAVNSLVGSLANDSVGSDGVIVFSSGNYVVTSLNWDNGAAVNAGAVTWGSGTIGVKGQVSIANSLVGSKGNDSVGTAVVVLTNGNYVVSSPYWDAGAVNVGAVTWGSGAAGVTGAVSAANSLVGNTANDSIGLFSGPLIGVTALSNGNYVVCSPNWDNGAGVNAGAVTWGKGTTGTVGTINGSNSLIGTKNGDNVGAGVTALTNGNYVAVNPNWDNGAVAGVGAVTWCSGATGASGLVSAANSLVGSTGDDSVGAHGVTALSNGNYVVRTLSWHNGPIVNAGAVTWGNGTSGISGAVSSANSLVGSSVGDFIGNGTVIALSNGNYVVRSYIWDNNAVVNAGAVTWGNGGTGVTGAITSANSLVGSTANDQVGGKSVIELSSGNYVVVSTAWHNGAVADAGAVTWGSGTTGITGVVSAANSLVGSKASDQIGDTGVVPLGNGNYVVRSRAWDNGAVVDAGAVTWGSGTIGVSGVVSMTNSLVGSTGNDSIGNGGVTALPDGNYVVNSYQWDNGAVVDAGAVTWGSGTIGVSGLVSPANSLAGSKASDLVGLGGVIALSNDNYVVISTAWDDGAAANVGAVTWCNGMNGVAGAVSALNSLIGSTSGDEVGSVTKLGNGNYVVDSFSWDNGGMVDTGAVTWAIGTVGVHGAITLANSIIGSVANATLQSNVSDNINGTFFGRFLTDAVGGRVRVGSQATGFGAIGSLSAAMIGNDLIVTDRDSTGKANNLTLSFDGANYVITDTTEQFWAVPASGILTNNNKTLTISTSAFTGKIIFNTQGGSDTVTVDWTSGNITRDIDFNGGTGTSDQFIIKGGSFSSAAVSYTNTNDGVVIMDPSGADPARTFTYTGLEPVDIRGANIIDLSLTLPAAASNAYLEDFGAGGDGYSQLRSNNGTFETTYFANPSNSLTINRGNAADSITVSAVPDFNRMLTLGTSANRFSTISFAGAITLTGSSQLDAYSYGGILLGGTVKSNTGAITLTSTGAITQTAGTVETSGTLTLAAVSGQMATFVSSGNKAASLVIPVGVACLVNGSFDSSGAVQVNGTLGGSGSVGTTTVTGTGKIAPGNSPGQLTTGHIAFNSGSVFGVEWNGPNVGSDYDQLVVNGTVNLGGATLSASLLYSPSVGQVFKIIDNDGTGDAVTGTFDGYIEGATVVIGGVNFTISYQGGDGNDVMLARQAAAPPPTVTSAVLDEGSGNTNIGGVNGVTQRSEVRRIIVTFSEAVNFTAAVAAAFSVSRSGTSSSAGSTGPVGLVANPANGPASSVTITFTGSFADSTGSLVDGLYNFSIDAQQVSGAGGKLNGSGGGAGTNYSATGSTANKWFRYYGDQNGDGTVDQTDYLVFRNALAGGPSSLFDYQNSGDVDQTDYLEFRNRLAGAP